LLLHGVSHKVNIHAFAQNRFVEGMAIKAEFEYVDE